MSRSGFYSDNELRSYPFQVGTSEVLLPTYVIVDFGCTFSPEAEFVDGVHSVWLHQVSKNNQSYKFEFKTDAPGLAGRSLVFEFFEDDSEFATRFSTDDLALGNYASWGSEMSPGTAWDGYLVIGILGYANYAMLPMGTLLWKAPPQEAMLWKSGSFLMEQIYPSDTGISNFGSLSARGDTVEPALIQNMSNIRRINIANKSRVMVTPPKDCYLSSSVGDSPAVINSVDSDGDIAIKPGYNCEIAVSVADNSITLSAALGLGEGEPCSEIPLDPLDGPPEIPPEGSFLLSGGPRCKDTIKTINGISGQTVSIKGGPGISVTASQLLDNTIVVEADLHGMALCGTYISSSIGG